MTTATLIGRAYTVDYENRHDPRTIIHVIEQNGESVKVRNHSGQEWYVPASIVADVVLDPNDFTDWSADA